MKAISTSAERPLLLSVSQRARIQRRRSRPFSSCHSVPLELGLRGGYIMGLEAGDKLEITRIGD